MKRYLVLCCFFAALLQAGAQDFSYGFKTGLNFSRFDGPLEMDSQGNEVEEFVLASGFQVGAIFNLAINDYFGLRGELLFSQKGGRYRYNGESFDVWTSVADRQVYLTGERRMSLNISNSYIDVPLLVYVRPVSWLEISGGVNAGVLVGSSGAGQMSFNGVSEVGVPVPEYSITLEYNYFRDAPGQGNLDNATELEVGGETILIPDRIGAYFQETAGTGKQFNRFDLGLNLGVNLFLNSSLFVGGRLNYGLLDVTNNDNDYSRVRLDENRQRIPRDDFDRNYSLQVTIGFIF
jgi:hypothetical protein